MLTIIRRIIRFDETTSSTVYAQYFRNTRTRCKSLDRPLDRPLDRLLDIPFNRSLDRQFVDEMIINKIKYHDLEKDDKMHILVMICLD